MATTNLLQWNPTASNQENDAAYLADSQRAGGATDPSIFQSVLSNKAFFQWSTYLTALFTAFANKGFTTSDSNLSTLTAQCANFLTSADLRGQISDPAYSPTQALDASKYNAWFLPLDGNVTLSISGMTDGQIVVLVYLQDATGGRTITFPTSFFEAVQPDARATACSAQAFIYTTAAGPYFRPIGPLMSDDGSLFIKGSASIEDAMFCGPADVSSLQIGGAAPSGQALIGNGTNYVPTTIPRAQGTAIDETSSRAFGTTYQNTTGGVLSVTGWGVTSGSSVGSVRALIGPASPTSPAFANTTAATVNNGACGFSFTVPAGWFYEIVANDLTNGMGSAVHAVGCWLETQIS